MNNNLTITIKRRTQSGWLLQGLFLLPFCLGTLNDLLGLPYSLRYILDILWIWLVILLAMNRRYIKKSGIQNLVCWVVLFLIFTLLTYLTQFQSPLYYLWGFRNNFRFYAAFLAFAAFLTMDDMAGFLKLLDRLFWLNVAVSLIQYFVFGIEQDFLGGIFGSEKGCNGYTNIYFLIVITKSVVFYLQKQETGRACISKCLAVLLVGALAELKFFFVEFLLVIALASLFTKFTWRKLLVIAGGILAVLLGAALLAILFPTFRGWFTLEYMLEVVTAKRGYTSTGDLNRLTAIISINDLWLKNPGQQLFGLGLGNCDLSSFAFLNTPFYRENGHMHYSWMSYAHMYLECGWIGLIFYYGFFASVYFGICRIEKSFTGIARDYCRVSKILTILCLPLTVYNASLRGESGYMMYFMLAVPFALKRQYSGKESQSHDQKTSEAGLAGREGKF